MYGDAEAAPPAPVTPFWYTAKSFLLVATLAALAYQLGKNSR